MHNLVDLKKVNSKLKFEILYATKNNFLGFPVYSHPLCYLHPDAIEAINEVQKEAEALNLQLLVYDGYRPLSVQKIMWDRVQDERYVSNPNVNKGRHTRGTAIDVTLLDALGNPLEMPTAFDDFSEKSHCDSFCNKVAHRNRALLRYLMEKNGFQMLPTEWWHFDLLGWKDDQRYPALDVSFDKLAR